MDACTSVRVSCGKVSEVALDVKISSDKVDNFAKILAASFPQPPAWDEFDIHYSDDADGRGNTTAAYVMVLDTLNWCFWPSKTGLEYGDLAKCLQKLARTNPSYISAEALQITTEADISIWLGSHDLPNLATRAAFLRELGLVLEKYCGSDPMRLIKGARHSAVALVDLLVAYMPNLRDEAVYANPSIPGSAQRVFFYKRAQIMVADIWAAFGRQTCTHGEAAQGVTTPPSSPRSGHTAVARLHPAAFYDIHRLTCFADYRLPQVLRSEGVLQFSESLARTVDGKVGLVAGSREEVEIRACTVAAVEKLRQALTAVHGQTLSAVELDWRLWQIGEVGTTTGDRPLAASHPHHRTDTVFY